MAVSHVLNLTQNLQGVVHGGDHVVKTVSDQFHLGVEGGISAQTVNRDVGEGTEFLLGAGVLLEDPDLNK